MAKGRKDERVKGQETDHYKSAMMFDQRREKMVFFRKQFLTVCFTVLFILSASGAGIAQQAQPAGGQAATAPAASQTQPTVTPTLVPIAPATPSQPADAAQAMPQLTPRQAELYQRLTPEQQRAIQAELGKTGGVLTPEAREALKARPEFKGLTPEEVLKGKALLEKEGIKLPSERKEAVEKSVIGGEAKDKTLFDRSRLVGEYQDVQLNLRPFGQDFFKEAAVRVVTERRDIPVPFKYVVGPGDEVKILLWGRVNAQYNLVVDRDGKITIPQIGPIPVAGMTFEDMSAKLIKQTEQIVGANIDITMGSLKTIPIFVLGDVKRPGAYTIGSFATITDALLLAGGPNEIGSMRKIQLKRKDQVITTFDLYDLLLKGDKSKDTILQAGDVVFVPVTGPLAGITGNVKRPAIYELREKFDLQHLFELAGGVIPTAYTQQIQIERIVRNEKQIVVDIDDKHLDKAGQFMLQDADLVKVFSIVDMNVNVVFLNGNVKRPGKYEIKPGMKIRDLVKDPMEFLPETYFDYALIKRINPPGFETVLIPFNLGRILFHADPADNLELRPQDQIFIFSKWFFKDKPFVTIEGEIRGDCKITGDEKGILPTKEKMSGPGNGGRLEAALIKIISIEEELRTGEKYYLQSKTREVREEIQKGRIASAEIRALQNELEKMERVDLAERLREIEREIRKSCTLDLSGNMKVKDAILNAGGLTSNAYLERGEIVRTNSKREYTTLYFNIAKAVADDPRENLILQDEDRIVIHSIWERVYKRSVAIDGEVTKPGSYLYTEKMTVKDLVFKAGNVLESAYLDDAEITSMISEAGQAGKVLHKNVNLKKALEGDPENNIVLNPYDRVFVKRIPQWRDVRFASVSGEFKFPGNYSIRKGERLSSLIERAGGYTDKAYLRGAYFTRQRVRQLQQKSLEEMAQRLERELLAEGAVQVSSSLSQEEVMAKKIELEQKKQLVESMKKLKATGRMTVVLTHLRLLKGSEYDIELEEGDSLNIPEKNSVINVVGAVMAPGSIIYTDKLRYENYINATGGYSKYADPDNAFVIKVDGSAHRLSRKIVNWNDSHSRWELAGFGEEIKLLEPGDVIVVPEKIEKIAWLREIRDITQILMNTAVVAGITIKLF